MTKDQLMWVVIRSTGFVLVLRSLLFVPKIVGTVIWLVYLGDVSVGRVEELKLTAEMARYQLTNDVVTCVTCLVFGIYLLRKGEWMFRLIGFVPQPSSNDTVERDARESGTRPSP